MREVINTLWYLTRRGCQGEMLPHDLLTKSRVYDYCAQWRDDGIWTTMMNAVRERVRKEAGREPTPSAACSDSQAVKTTEMGGGKCGHDGGKKLKGRKRHLRVETLGLLSAGLITGANVDDGAAAAELLAQVSARDLLRLETIFGDHKYNNHALEAWLAGNRPGWRIAVKTRPEGSTGFRPVRKRWVVERTKAWNDRSRRNRKDYERKPEAAAAMSQISQLHLTAPKTRSFRPARISL